GLSAMRAGCWRTTENSCFEQSLSDAVRGYGQRRPTGRCDLPGHDGRPTLVQTLVRASPGAACAEEGGQGDRQADAREARRDGCGRGGRGDHVQDARGPQWVVAVGLRGPVSGRRSRTKGASFEREVARQLRALWPGARRGIGQARSGGETPDVIQTPFWIEAKHRKK